MATPKWLINVILVSSLFLFSGYASPSKRFHTEPTKTELKQTVRANTVKTVCLTNQLSVPDFLYQKSLEQKEIFKSYQVLYERKLAVRLKNNLTFRVRKKLHTEFFLAAYPSDNSEESNSI